MRISGQGDALLGTAGIRLSFDSERNRAPPLDVHHALRRSLAARSAPSAVYAGRIHDYFTSHPDRFRLMSWGQLELDAGDSPPHDTYRESVARKIEQIREAQEAGHLDADWDPVDILVFVHQISTAWVAQPDLLPPHDEGRATFLTARRAAIVAAVERLLPATRAISQ
ncbi:hypothetical protein AB0M87_26505 [Streptomyces sp. NPDC051320]|uniref:hypothetical protein n=1 Tax=Streptomyces sp. NPDC051320 TaxID=3154644 RepID=UPI0034308D80